MAHTVQSFIETLRTDGIEAGRKAADDLLQETRQQADQLIQEAQAKAERIVQQADQQRQQTVERTRTDLELAARDTVARLREALMEAINRVLQHAASRTLEDTDFLQDLIRQVVQTYAESDAVGEQAISLNVPEPMRHKLADWAIASFHQGHGKEELSVELHGALSTAGFEYKVSGGTVEVTPESVVQVMSQIVTPELRELVAASQEGDASGEAERG